jgi:uncharacterized protein Yka (UPF0111/DUF47 family)
MSDATENTTETVETTATPKESLENMIATAESLRTAAEAAQVAYEESLQAIASEYDSTYTINGQVFQIRHREDSKQGRPITYLCKLKAEPKTWLTGRKRKSAPETTEANTVAAATATVIPETGGPTVIE